jgi:hypothetical protein
MDMGKSAAPASEPAGENSADAAMTAPAGTSDQDNFDGTVAITADPQRIVEMARQIDALTTERDNARDALATATVALAKATARVAELEANVPAPPRANKSAKPIALSTKATAEEFMGATMICFTDENDVLIKGLTPLTFASDLFSGDGNGRLLNAAIEFPRDMPGSAVSAIWLITDDGQAVGRAALVSAFSVGGGKAARIPAGSLAFRFG